MPKRTARKSKHKSRSNDSNTNKVITVQVGDLTPTIHHKFLIDDSRDSQSPLYYILIFFTLFLMIAAIYAGVDSSRMFEVGKIDNFSECIQNRLSIIRESYPRTCTTRDGRSFVESVYVVTDPTPTIKHNRVIDLKLTNDWRVDRLGHDAADIPTVWIIPNESDSSDGVNYPSEVVIGGKSINFKAGDVCESNTCDFYQGDFVTFGGTSFPIDILINHSNNYEVPVFSFQAEIEEGRMYISALFFNFDQLDQIKELLESLDEKEVNDILSQLSIESGYTDLWTTTR